MFNFFFSSEAKTKFIEEKLMEQNTLIVTDSRNINFYEEFCASKNLAANVMSVNGFFEYIKITIGGEVIEKASKNEYLANICNTIKAKKPDFKIFKDLKDYSSLTEDLFNLIRELLFNNVDYDKIVSYLDTKTAPTGILRDKLTDLLLILNGYEKISKTSEIKDFNRIIQNLSNCKKNIFENIIFDDIIADNDLQIDILSLSAKLSDNTYFAYKISASNTVNNKSYKSKMNTILSLKDQLSKLNVFFTDKKHPSMASDFEIFDENYFSNKAKETKLTKISCFPANNQKEEITWLLTKIEDLIQQGYHYDDINICSAQMTDYLPMIIDFFNLNKINYQINIGQPMTKSSFCQHILLSYQAAKNPEDLKLTLDAAMTGLIEINTEDLKELSAAVERYGSDKATALSNMKKYDEAKFNKVNSILEEISAQTFMYDFPEKANFHDFVRLISNNLKELQSKEFFLTKLKETRKTNNTLAYDNIKGEWNMLISILDDAYKNNENNEVSCDDFMSVFKTMAIAKKINRDKKYLNCVNISSIEKSSYNNKIQFVIGLTDKSLLTYTKEEVFCEEEKKVLNREINANLTLSEDMKLKKSLTLNNVLTTAQDFLFISYPKLDENMIIQKPFYLINKWEENISLETLEKSETEELEFFSLISALSELNKTGMPVADEIKEKIGEFLKNPRYALRMEKAKKFILKDISKFGEENLKPFLSQEKDFAITQIECFNQCAFKHFIKYFLKPKEKKLFEETKADEGSFYHDVLCNFYRTLKAQNIDISTFDVSKIDDILNPIIEEIAETHNENILKASKENLYLFKNMKKCIKKAVTASLLQIQKGSFSPEFLEYEIKKLTFEIDGNLYFGKGKVDRIDTCEDNGKMYARVIDYKSGDKTFNKAHFNSGIQLQLPLYLSSLDGYVSSGMYYFNIKADKISNPQISLKKYRLNGITVNDKGIFEMTDTELTESSTVSDIVPISTISNGDCSKNSKVETRESFKEILNKSEEIFKTSITKIISGENQASPIALKDYNPCEYCNYKFICCTANK